jgi:hypothetical protein
MEASPVLYLCSKKDAKVADDKIFAAAAESSIHGLEVYAGWRPIPVPVDEFKRMKSEGELNYKPELS